MKQLFMNVSIILDLMFHTSKVNYVYMKKRERGVKGESFYCLAPD